MPQAVRFHSRQALKQRPPLFSLTGYKGTDFNPCLMEHFRLAPQDIFADACPPARIEIVQGINMRKIRACRLQISQYLFGNGAGI